MLPERGVYLVEFDLACDCVIRVGRSGERPFARGRYVYVGSAQAGLPHRVARHARKGKPLRWHVDYLAEHATATAAWAWAVSKQGECAAARLLQHAFGSVRGFGCSDCACRSHLFVCTGRDAAALISGLFGPPEHTSLTAADPPPASGDCLE